MEIKVTVKKEETVRPKLLKLCLKVRDEFSAALVDEAGTTIKDQDNGYVPSFMPGDHCGDYVILDIDVATGQIMNWSPEGFQAHVAEWIEGEDE